MPGPVTIGDPIASGRLLWVYCRTCYRERDFEPVTLTFALDQPVPSAGKRMRCSACGGRNISTAPEHVPGGVVALRAMRQAKGRARPPGTCLGDRCRRGGGLDLVPDRALTYAPAPLAGGRPTGGAGHRAAASGAVAVAAHRPLTPARYGA